MISRQIGSILVILAVMFVAAMSSAQTVEYKVIPLISPFSGMPLRVGAAAINAGGEIAATDSAGGMQQAFLIQSGKSIPLTLLGGTCNTAFGINHAGNVVGGSCLPGDTTHHAYLYRNKKTTDLGTFGGVGADGQVINHLDQIGGVYALDDGSVRAFSWKRNKWVDLGDLGGSFVYPFSINRSGTIAGQSDISDDLDPVFNIPQFHGFIWSAGTLTDLGSIFGSNFNYADAINDAGLVTGSADLPGDTAAHAFILNQGTVQDLTPYDGVVAWGVGINNSGQVIGSWGDFDDDPEDGPPVEAMECPCNAVLWSNGGSTFLTDVVPAGWDLYLGMGINDRGEILAYGTFNNGHFERVLLKPIPGAPHNALRHANAPLRPAHHYSGPRAIKRDRTGRISIIR